MDCGDLSRLSLSELHAVDTVFLSHGHIDHWIGFDQLLRAQLFQGHELRILGPAGLHDMLEGKLRGYTWNLVADSQLVIAGYEWNGGKWLRRDYPCARRFQSGPLAPAELPALEGWELSWVELQHGVPCLGFRLQAPRQFRFRVEQAQAEGLAPGPWVEQLKRSRALGHSQLKLRLGERELSAESLWDLLEELEPCSLAYITDTRLGPDIRLRIVERFGPTQQLWCEAAFLEHQSQLAQDKLHATAREAAQLAIELPARELHLFHLSRRTQGQAEEHLREARALFPNVYC